MSAKWEIVGGFLGLSISVIDNIKATAPVTTVGCWHEALKNWIKQNYNTGKQWRRQDFDKEGAEVYCARSARNFNHAHLITSRAAPRGMPACTYVWI